jgi:hypothetical protein
MKKIFIITALALCSFTAVNAQGGGNPTDAERAAFFKARLKERQKPDLIERAKLTDAEAEKVVEIQFEYQEAVRNVRSAGKRDSLTEEQTKKLKELDADRDKRLKEIPLTDDKLKAVTEYYEEMRKRIGERGRGPGGRRGAGAPPAAAPQQ